MVLIVLGGGAIYTMYLYLSKIIFYFELKLCVFVMTEAVSNKEIRSIKAVLLLCKH